MPEGRPGIPPLASSLEGDNTVGRGHPGREMRAASDPAAPSEERTAIPQRHPATAKAWAWFDENEAAMEFSRRVSILDKLLELDRLLRDLDGGTAE